MSVWLFIIAFAAPLILPPQSIPGDIPLTSGATQSELVSKKVVTEKTKSPDKVTDKKQEPKTKIVEYLIDLFGEYKPTYWSFLVRPTPGSNGYLYPEEREKWEGSHFPTEVKFQLSFMFDVFPNPTPFELHFTFAQVMFWPIGQESSPVRETNYSPGGRLTYRHSGKCQPLELYGNNPTNCNRKKRCANRFNQVRLDQVAAGIEHQSDGEGVRRVDESRGWNRFYLEGIVIWDILSRFKSNFKNEKSFEPILSFEPRLRLWWAHLGSLEDTNWNIVRYQGLGELGLKAKLETQYFGVRVENTTRIGIPCCSQLGGNYEDFKFSNDEVYASNMVEIHLRIGKRWNKVKIMGLKPCIYLQHFSGYGESLKNYDRYSNSIYVGLSLLSE